MFDLECRVTKKIKNHLGAGVGARGLPWPRRAEQGRAGIVVLCLVAVIGAAVAYWLIPKRGSKSPTAAPGSSADQRARPDSTAAKSPSPRPASPEASGRETNRGAAASGTSPSAPGSGPEAPRTAPSALARQLVASLSQPSTGHGPLTPEQAATWKQSLQQLAEQRGAAVPAIREFLEKNADIHFDSEADRDLIGFPSLRLALLQTLQGTGGPEALGVFVRTLQSTADPLEIATLTKYLEQSDPAKYREAELSAAREALNQAASGKLEGRDIGPLMEILKQFGGPNIVAELQKLGNTWFDYTPMALAQLPDGAGVPALIAWAKNPDSTALTGNEIYLRMLGQVSVQYPNAFEALVEQAAANRIPNSAWAGIAAALGGSSLDFADSVLGSVSPPASQSNTRQYHIAAGNQNLLDLPPPDDMTSAQAADRLRMVDRLLGSTTNPQALQALQNTRTALSARIK